MIPGHLHLSRWLPDYHWANWRPALVTTSRKPIKQRWPLQCSVLHLKHQDYLTNCTKSWNQCIPSIFMLVVRMPYAILTTEDAWGCLHWPALDSRQVISGKSNGLLPGWWKVIMRIYNDTVHRYICIWISNHKPSKLWYEITYPFPNFNGTAIEVWEWLSNFILYFIMDVIINSCCCISHHRELFGQLMTRVCIYLPLCSKPILLVDSQYKGPVNSLAPGRFQFNFRFSS